MYCSLITQPNCCARPGQAIFFVGVLRAAQAAISQGRSDGHTSINARATAAAGCVLQRAGQPRSPAQAH
eukprot:3057374-Prymnesium_polylepis.1